MGAKKTKKVDVVQTGLESVYEAVDEATHPDKMSRDEYKPRADETPQNAKCPARPVTGGGAEGDRFCCVSSR
jgi:hypothetical protein